MAKKLENIYKKEKKDITFEKCGLDIEKNFISAPPCPCGCGGPSRLIAKGKDDILRYQAGILGHSMTEMKAFFTSDFNTLKIRSMVLRLHFEYLQKKVIHCSVISYK